MSDIVERLRAMEPCQSDDWKIAREGAAEIERLREALESCLNFMELDVSGSDHELRWNLIEAARAALDAGRRAGGDVMETIEQALARIPAEVTAWELRTRQRKTRFVCTLSWLTDDEEEERAGHGETPQLAIAAAIAKYDADRRTR